jgi:hypothetical protein
VRFLRLPLPSTSSCERWLTCGVIIALNRRGNLCYINSWVLERDGAKAYPPEFAVEPVKAAYAAKLASGDTAYDNLKKMCDGMLGTKDERWSLQTCLVRDVHTPSLDAHLSVSR